MNDIEARVHKMVGEVGPKAGETWHVCINNAQCLAKEMVMEITPKTVLLAEDRLSTPRRYKRDLIEFVEKSNELYQVTIPLAVDDKSLRDTAPGSTLMARYPLYIRQGIE